jgi:hypothetical protein
LAHPATPGRKAVGAVTAWTARVIKVARATAPMARMGDEAARADEEVLEAPEVRAVRAALFVCSIQITLTRPGSLQSFMEAHLESVGPAGSAAIRAYQAREEEGVGR